MAADPPVPPPEPVITTTMFTPAEQAAWAVAVERGLSIEAADLRHLLEAAVQAAAGEGLRVLTDAVNRIAGQIDFPLGAAEDLMRAVATYTTLQVSRAAAAEHERMAKLAEQEAAKCDGPRAGGSVAGDALRGLADLIREEAGT